MLKKLYLFHHFICNNIITINKVNFFSIINNIYLKRRNILNFKKKKFFEQIKIIGLNKYIEYINEQNKYK